MIHYLLCIYLKNTTPDMIKLSDLAWLKHATILFVVIFTALVASLHLGYASLEYETLEWEDLLPPLDLAAVQDQIIDHSQSIDDSSEPTWESDADIIGAEIDSWDNPQYIFEDQAYQSALISTKTVDKYDGKNIRIPGFIVPLEFDEELTITQFFLVPYFGACMHLPAPPPNQMILVNYPKGIQMEPFYAPVLISGMLSVEVMENELGISAYTMDMESMEDY